MESEVVQLRKLLEGELVWRAREDNREMLKSKIGQQRNLQYERIIGLWRELLLECTEGQGQHCWRAE